MQLNVIRYRLSVSEGGQGHTPTQKFTDCLPGFTSVDSWDLGAMVLTDC